MTLFILLLFPREIKNNTDINVSVSAIWLIALYYRYEWENIVEKMIYTHAKITFLLVMFSLIKLHYIKIVV